MIIGRVPGVMPQRILVVSSLEYVVMKCAVGTIADLMEENPELFKEKPQLLILLDVARNMWKEMETPGDHVPVQDPPVSTSGVGDQTHVPPVAEWVGGRSVVRSSNREEQDGN